jgi:hypothetical protein
VREGCRLELGVLHVPTLTPERQFATGRRNGFEGVATENPRGGPESRLWAAVVQRAQDARTAGPDVEYLKLGIIHLSTLAPDACGLLGYKSYSIGAASVLYKADAPDPRSIRSSSRFAHAKVTSIMAVPSILFNSSGDTAGEPDGDLGYLWQRKLAASSKEPRPRYRACSGYGQSGRVRVT